ncbi:MAG: hypothetical protein LBQ42_06700 [Synergistaceae bacterium]|jgi:hypothetical protein|nr:hypothetical protein [Synergistaceae bacterium]
MGRLTEGPATLREFSGEDTVPKAAKPSPMSFPDRRSPKKIPFRFEGKDYFTTEELALAFAVSQTPWLSAETHLRYIQKWFEGNMLFDEAAELANENLPTLSERALFRFIHTNALCPFAIWGQAIDVDAVFLFLGRAVRGEASNTEERLTEMLGDGQLLSFYNEYAAFSGQPRDSFLYKLLLFMDRKTLRRQWSYVEAMRNPYAWVWPGDLSTGCPEEILDCLVQMDPVFPIERQALEKFQELHDLPRALLDLFRSVPTYASGLERLESWKTRGLLIPRTSVLCLYENLSLEEYEQLARVRCLGHSSVMLAKIAFVIDGLSAFLQLQNQPQNAPKNILQAERASSVIERLKALRERKITSSDTFFILKAAELLSKRGKIRRVWWVRYALSVAGGVGGALLFNLIRIRAGNPNRCFFWYSIVVGLGGLLWNIFDRLLRFRELRSQDMNDGNRRRLSRQGNLVILLVVLSGYLSFGALPLLLPEDLLRAASWVLGAVPGMMIPYTLGGLFLPKNTKSILKACDDYGEH